MRVSGTIKPIAWAVTDRDTITGQDYEIKPIGDKQWRVYFHRKIVCNRISGDLKRALDWCRSHHTARIRNAIEGP